MKNLAYWGARTGIFLAVLGALYLVGWFDVIAFIAAFILAWLISYLLLPGLRREAAMELERLLDRPRQRLRSLDEEEDLEVSTVAIPEDTGSQDALSPQVSRRDTSRHDTP